MASVTNDPTKDYMNYIKGKKVIFVGPAPTLIDSNEGEWIDSFDVIVRTNGSIFLLEKDEYIKDYGSRCDVLYSNVQFLREMSPFPLKKWIDDYKLKFLNAKTIRGVLRKQYGELIPIRTLQHIEQNLKQSIDGLLMGPIVITDILDFKPKYLYVTGMDFYMTKPKVFIPGDYREYYPDYLPEKIRKRADIVNRGRIDPHNQASNTKYIYHLYQQGLIDIDPIMGKCAVKAIKKEDV